MKDNIREFIYKTTFSDPKKINDATLLFDEGIFDSMGLLSLIAFLEKDYNVKVGDSELNVNNFGSINAIASFLSLKLKSRNLYQDLQ